MYVFGYLPIVIDYAHIFYYNGLFVVVTRKDIFWKMLFHITMIYVDELSAKCVIIS